MSKITRREFIKLGNQTLAVLGAAAVATPVVAYFYPPKLEEMPSEPVLVCKEEELPFNESKVVRFGRYPAIVINTTEGLKGYSSVCTHFACLVKWDQALQQLVCPCHEGYFSANDGSVISGPPPKPLLELNVTVINGEIFVGVKA